MSLMYKYKPSWLKNIIQKFSFPISINKMPGRGRPPVYGPGNAAGKKRFLAEQRKAAKAVVALTRVVAPKNIVLLVNYNLL